MKKGPEALLQKACLDLLAAKHILAFRQQSGATVSNYKGKTRMIRYGVQGMADVLAFPTLKAEAFAEDDPRQARDGTMVDTGIIEPLWIECKAAKGRQTPEQKSFQVLVESHGHRYAVVRSLEELEALL